MDSTTVSRSELHEAALIRVALGLARELHSRPRPLACGSGTLDAELDRDWGFDSLSRAELLCRVERDFKVRLPERLLGEAATLRDILTALERTEATPEPVASIALGVLAEEREEAAPAGATTLIEVLDWHVRVHGERCHVVLQHQDGTEEALTYRELHDGARAAACGLRRAGLEPGERVALMLPTGVEFLVAFFGILYAGGIPMPIYPPVRPAQIEEHLLRQAAILRNARSALLIAPPDMTAIARLLKFQVESLRRIVSVPELDRREMVEAECALPAYPEPLAIALLQYTSGSTGDPKGVVLSHANLLANIRAMGEVMEATSTDVFVSWLPLYHDMGLIGAWLGCLYFGAPLILMSPLTFLMRPEQWLWAIHHHRATLAVAPNFAFELCIRKIPAKAIAGLDLSSLRMLLNGAEAVLPETLRRFTGRFSEYGFHAEALAPVYGLAENAVGLAFPPLGREPIIDRINRHALIAGFQAVPAGPDDCDAVEFVACGHPLPGHQIRIVDAHGEVGERREGRLQFRGPSATAGYLENPAKNAALFDGDWLDSGDLAYISAGDIFITGRSKDIVIRAGRNIHPEEVEAAIGDIDGIRKGCVAAIGASDPKTGTERIVILAETRETEQAIQDSIREKATCTASALIEGADEIVLVPPHAIPKTSSGKIRRAAARALYEEGRLTREPPPVWRQFLNLLLAGGGPQARRTARALGEILYAGWWWSVILAMGLFLWPAVILLPRRRWRWALLHRAARLAFKAMRIPIETAGTPSPAPGNILANVAGNIIAVNHSSYLDGLVLAAVLPGELVFVAKKELQSQFFAGIFLRAIGALFVDRHDPEGGVEDTRRALEAAAKGRILVFFPEGTFTRAPGLLPFRLGAFVIAAQQNLPILPLTLRGTRSILRGDQWFPRRGAIRVHWGTPIPPEGSDFMAAVRLRGKTRAAILCHCGEPDMGSLG